MIAVYEHFEGMTIALVPEVHYENKNNLPREIKRMTNRNVQALPYLLQYYFTDLGRSDFGDSASHFAANNIIAKPH